MHACNLLLLLLSEGNKYKLYFPPEIYLSSIVFEVVSLAVGRNHLDAGRISKQSKATELLLVDKKLHGPSPRANYTDRATAACRRSDCQLLRIEGATWSA
jgi:hypothetical protein